MDQPHTTRIAHRFDPDADANVGGEIFCSDRTPKLLSFFLGTETNLVEVLLKFLGQEIKYLVRFRSSAGIFDSGVNIFRVFAEDNHVDLFRTLYGRGNTFEILHRPQTNIQVEQLSQRDIQGSNPAADRSRQRAFNADKIFAKRVDRVIRKPGIKLVHGCLAGKNFKPRDFLLAAVSFLDRGIEDAHARGPDVRPGPVAANERNHGVIRDA